MVQSVKCSPLSISAFTLSACDRQTNERTGTSQLFFICEFVWKHSRICTFIFPFVCRRMKLSLCCADWKLCESESPNKNKMWLLMFTMESDFGLFHFVPRLFYFRYCDERLRVNAESRNCHGTQRTNFFFPSRNTIRAGCRRHTPAGLHLENRVSLLVSFM